MDGRVSLETNTQTGRSRLVAPPWTARRRNGEGPSPNVHRSCLKNTDGPVGLE